MSPKVHMLETQPQINLSIIFGNEVFGKSLGSNQVNNDGINCFIGRERVVKTVIWVSVPVVQPAE